MGFLSYILILDLYSGSQENPCSTAEPTNPFPIIPMFRFLPKFLPIDYIKNDLRACDILEFLQYHES